MKTGRRRLILMRHGAVDYFAPRVPYRGRDDVPLTEDGVAQARAAGRALRGTPLDRVVVSGLLRTASTAENVLHSAEQTGLRIETLDDLRELRAGSFDPRKVTPEMMAARLAFSLDGADKPGARFLGDGEAFEDAYGRISKALETLIMNEDWGTALVVAHEGVNRLALAWASGGGLAVAKAFEQDFARLSVIDVDVVVDEEGAARLERIIIKTVNAPPFDGAHALDRRTSVEALFGLEAGAVRMRS